MGHVEHLGCVPTSTSHEKLAEARAMVLKKRTVTIPEIAQKLSAKGQHIQQCAIAMGSTRAVKDRSQATDRTA
jgi:hypothetical protein